MKFPTTEKATDDSRASDDTSNQLDTSQLNANHSKEPQVDVTAGPKDDAYLHEAPPSWQAGPKKEPAPASPVTEQVSSDQVPGGAAKDVAFEQEINGAPEVDANSTVGAEISYQPKDTPVKVFVNWTETEAKLGFKVDVTDNISTRVDFGLSHDGLVGGADVDFDSESAANDRESDYNPGTGAGGDPDQDAPLDAETDNADDNQSDSLLDQFLNAVGLGDKDNSDSSNDETGGQQNDNSSDNGQSDNSSNDDENENSDNSAANDDEDDTSDVDQAEADEEADDGTEPPPQDDYNPETSNPKAVSAEQWDAAQDKIIGEQSWDVTPGWDDGSGDNPNSEQLFDINEGKPVVNPKETVYNGRPDDIEYQDQMSAEAINVIGNLAIPTNEDADGVWGQPDPGPGPSDPFGGTDPTAAEFMFFEQEPLPQGLMGTAQQPMSRALDSDMGVDSYASSAAEPEYDLIG